MNIMEQRRRNRIRKVLQSSTDMLSRCYTGNIEEPYNNDEVRDLITKIEQLIDELNQ